MTNKKSSARCRLLEAASRLFQKRWYSEVGIDEIIQTSETAKASFYNHFPSKDLLVEAWLKAVHEGSEQQQQAILEADGCPIQKISDSFDALADYMEKHDYRGCPYSNSCAVTDPDNEVIRKQIEIHKRSSRNFYRRLCSSITSDADLASQLGDCIFILYSGATTEAQNLREDWPIKAAGAAAVDMLRKAS